MNLPLNLRVLLARPLPQADADALLGTALALQRAASEGLASPLLKGRHIGVAAAGGASAGPAAEAAERLGARISPIPIEPSLLEDGAPDVARMLGRLYDAVAVEDLPPERAAALQRQLGMPVYSGLSALDHPLRTLAQSLPPDGGAYLVQALLVNTVDH